MIVVWMFLVSWAKYAGDFEELAADAGIEGRGKTGVVTTYTASSIYYNPSTTSREDGISFSFLHSSDFGGIVKNNFVSFVKSSKGAGIGFALYRVGVDSISIVDTTSYDPTKPVSDTNYPKILKEVSTADWIFYSNFSKKIQTFSIGINLKFIYRDLYFEHAFGGGTDVGFCMELKDLVVSLVVKNISSSVLFWSNDSIELMAPKIFMGMGLKKKRAEIAFLGVIQEVYELDTKEFFYRIGGEVIFRNAFVVRAGLWEGGLAVGGGLRYGKFFFDYAFIPWQDGSHIVSTEIKF